LLDVGIYCLSPILTAMGGPPSSVAAHVTRTGTVDATTVAWLRWPSGATASVVTSIELAERQSLLVCGTNGTLAVDRPFTPGMDDTSFAITRQNGEVERRSSAGGNCYLGMIEAFAASVRGRSAWPRPVEEAIAMAVLCDRIREAATAAGGSA
jgi:predicted dehydrogenase